LAVAIEVASRQADGSWRWLIGDPFTVWTLSKNEEAMDPACPL